MKTCWFSAAHVNRYSKIAIATVARSAVLHRVSQPQIQSRHAITLATPIARKKANAEFRRRSPVIGLRPEVAIVMRVVKVVHVPEPKI